MKRALLFITLIFCLPLYGQDKEDKPNIQIEAGFLFHRNDLNEDNYLDNKSPWGFSGNSGNVGIDLRFVIPSKIKSLDFVFGTLFEKCWDEYLGTTTDYKLNGGGIYAGISPKIKGKYVGLTSTLALGVLSYKEYFAFYSENPATEADIYEKKTSYGLGAMSSIGVYGKLGPVGLHPQFQAIFSGGANASFLFYGFVIPLTIQF